MRFLRYFLRELKWLSEVVIEELHLLWGETALCGNVACGGETCREFGSRQIHWFEVGDKGGQTPTLVV